MAHWSQRIGLIRNDTRLLTLSVVVVFLYGGLIWGIFPINPDISWEGHLWGAISGVVLAIYYRKFIIRRDKFDWEDEEEEEDSSLIGNEEVDSAQLQEKGKGNEKSSESENNKPNNISHTGQF